MTYISPELMGNVVRVTRFRQTHRPVRVETIFPVIGVDTPIPKLANVAAWWAAIQRNEHAARVLIELHRGVEERREMICSGEIERFRATAAAAQKAAEAQD